MDNPTPAPGRRGSAPNRSALSVLIVFYTLCLAGMVSLLVLEASRTNWRQLGVNGTRPLVRPRKTVAQRTPARQPARASRPATRPARRVIVWHTPPAQPAQGDRARRRTTRQTARATLARRSTPRTAGTRTARRPSEPRHRLRIILAPARRPLVTWAHPPDLSLPPECRPRNPVVVSQF